MKILSLGAGVQSSTIFLMSCYGELEKLDHAIFADTGWEPKAVYDWLEFLKSEGKKYNIPVHVVSNGNLKDDALTHQRTNGVNGRFASIPYFTKNKDGSKGMVRRQCTSEYKTKPLKRKQRELLGYQPRKRIPAGSLELWLGISTDEMKRVKFSIDKWIDNYYPLIDIGMSRTDCLEWFDKKGFPRPPKSSCIGCPFHSDNQWREIKNRSDKEWKEAIDFDAKMRRCDGLDGELYLHSKRIPLDEVDLSTLEDEGQMTLFDDECSGVCGV
jgi:hypothetical protein